jgi:4-hydroxymandelate oxidase
MSDIDISQMPPPINLAEIKAIAQENLSSSFWDYYRSGAGDEVTLKLNREAFQGYQVLPKMLVDVSQRDLSTTLFGQSLSMPILIAPTAFQGLAHPEGEIATAQAAQTAKTIMVLSTMSNQSLEAVAQAQSQPYRWFQLYIHKDRALTKELVQRAEAAGYQALCVTVDAPLIGKREADIRNQFQLPAHLTLGNLSQTQLPNIPQGSSLFAYFQQQIDPGVTWKDLEWLKSLTHLPILLKGILRADDAQRACQLRVNGIIVSNHGGRQLDGAIASIDALGTIVNATGGELDILVDGGIRRGIDVFKALALGAKAVLIGRPILWGLAMNGEAGVQLVLELLRQELDLAMALSGCSSLQEIDSSFIQKVHNASTK